MKSVLKNPHIFLFQIHNLNVLPISELISRILLTLVLFELVLVEQYYNGYK